MTTTTTPGTKTEDLLTRDRWGRPLVVPPAGGKPIPYTRVSTLAKALDDTTMLTNWKMRQTAIGLQKRPDLMALLATRPDRKKLDEIVQTALDAASSDAAANLGTALHSFAEAADLGEPFDTIPAEHQPRIRQYRQTLADAGITVVACEKFVVCDDLETAGTFDRLLQLPDGRLIVGDIKTGSGVDWIGLSTAMQVAVYSRGLIYNPETHERHPLPVDTTVGVLIHLPQGGDGCTLHELDLQEGWFAALQAFDVRRTRKKKPIRPWAGPAQLNNK